MKRRLTTAERNDIYADGMLEGQRAMLERVLVIVRRHFGNDWGGERCERELRALRGNTKLQEPL